MNKDQLRKDALARYQMYLNLLNTSELTLVHRTPGEDHCCEDVADCSKEKKRLAKEMAMNSILWEMANHSTIAMILSSHKIRRLSDERAIIQTL